MLRVLAFIAVLFFPSGAADAQIGQKVLLFSGAPGWVLRAGGVPANVDMNFATGQYYGCSLASCLSITRASSKTNLLPSSPSGFAYTTFGNNVLAIDSNGLLIEEARTNQLLNSTALVTQTTGSLANGTYTLWVNGTGTATMSAGTATGCGTGVASQGTPVNFTTSGTAGTCIVTVAGTLQGNLELGAFGTSLIVTAGATATRATDAITASGPLLALAVAAPVTERFKTNLVTNTTTLNYMMMTADSKDRFYFASNTTIKAVVNNNILSAQTIGGAGVATGLVASVLSWGAAGTTYLANQGTEFTSATTRSVGAAAVQVGNGPLDGYLSRWTLWNFVAPASVRSTLSNQNL